MELTREILRKWQGEAFDKWKITRKGIVEAGTGVGKTIFAMFCMSQYRASTIIIVPTVVLMKQWKTELLKHLPIAEDNIGFYYANEKQLKPVTIAVINSVREEDLSMFDMVICDEIHRYGSIENIKPLKKSNFQIKLGLTATLEREDGAEKELIKYIGDVVYRYTSEDGIKDGVLNKFKLVNVGVDLDITERADYDRADMIFKDKFASFNYNLPAMIKCLKNFMNPKHKIAKEGMENMRVRKEIYSNSVSKIHKAVELIEKHKNDKVIVFNEYIVMAERIYDRCIHNNIRAGMYHSGQKNLDVIKDFSEGKINVLIAVKSLNEGLDVKDANIGIMVSSNTVKRNTIQRLGRVIRKEEGKEAIFYQLFCRGTKEFKDIQDRVKLLMECAEGIEWE